VELFGAMKSPNTFTPDAFTESHQVFVLIDAVKR
jgi:hypothetical protein